MFRRKGISKEIYKYIIRSNVHEMYLQLVQKSALPLFDVKRRFINNIESIPSN